MFAARSMTKLSGKPICPGLDFEMGPSSYPCWLYFVEWDLEQMLCLFKESANSGL